MSMLERFKRLFSTADADAPSQEQREALIDLMIWTMYADGVLALPENDRIDQAAESMAWESVLPVGQYISTSIARVRGILDDEMEAAAFLDEVHDRLADDAMRRRAYDACCELAQADGHVAEAEARLLETLRTRFDITPA